MLTAFVRAFRTPDLRRKLLFTIFIIAVFRLGASLPTPGISEKAVDSCLNLVKSDNTGLFQLVNLFSGGALYRLSVFALGIMPYITASIILQLLAVVIPRLETLRQEGQAGQAKITQYTRYLTCGLAILQSTAIVALARSGTLYGVSGTTKCSNLIPNQGVFNIATMVITITAGTCVIMWLGELITDRGVGNGMSIMIFTTVISQIPGEFETIYQEKHAFVFGVVLLVGVAVIAFVAFMEQAQRRIPVQYAKRMVGRKMYGGTSTYIPLKVNQAGVIPVIFGSSLLYIPQLAAQLFGGVNGAHPKPWADWVVVHLSYGDNPVYMARDVPADHLLHVLLRLDHVQPDRGRGQHEEVRGVHPRHQTRPADGRVPELRAEPADHSRLDLPGARRPDSAGGHRAGRRHAAVPAGRHQPADHGRRRPGHGEADREPATAA